MDASVSRLVPTVKSCATGADYRDRVVIGTWGLGGDAYGRISTREVRELLHSIRDYGFDTFDTSPSYGGGRSEEMLGQAFRHDQSIRIFSKVGMLSHSGLEVPQDFSSTWIRTSLEGSLRRLGRDYIDVLQLHSPLGDYLVRFPDVLDDLRSLKTSGLIRDYALSARSPQLAVAQESHLDWRFVQTNFSLLDQRFLDIQAESGKTLVNSTWGARTVLNFGFLAADHHLDLDVPGHHLANWPRAQIERWQWGSEAYGRLAAEFGRPLYELAVRAPIDVGRFEFFMLGLMRPSELPQLASALSASELTGEEISRVRELYSSIKSSLVVESPYEYVNRKEEEK